MTCEDVFCYSRKFSGKNLESVIECRKNVSKVIATKLHCTFRTGPKYSPTWYNGFIMTYSFIRGNDDNLIEVYSIAISYPENCKQSNISLKSALN